MEYSEQDLKEASILATALKMVEARKHDTVGTTGGQYAGIDSGGAFSYPQGGSEIISAMLQPQSWLETLPLRRSLVRNEVQTILTGQQDETGANPANTCGVPPKPGNLKTCNVLTRYGQMFIGTNTLKLDELAFQDSYATRPDKRIINGAEVFAGSWIVPEALRRPVNVASAGAIEMFKLSNAIKRILARVEIVGDQTKTNTTTSTGWIKEFDSLDRLIAPVTDVASGLACGAASPITIETWSGDVGATVNGRTLPQLMTMIWRAANELAMKTGIMAAYGDPRLTWIMDKRLFYELVDVVACNYASVRCAVGDAGNPTTRSADILEMRRIEMFNGQYILIDNVKTPVVFTSGAEVDESTDPLNSSLYLIPLNPALTYLEYAPFDDTLITETLQDFNLTPDVRVENRGLYMMFKNQTRACFEASVTAWMRLQLRARFLTARIDGIEFTSFVGYRDWNPRGSSWYNGGSTVYTSYFPPAS